MVQGASAQLLSQHMPLEGPWYYHHRLTHAPLACAPPRSCTAASGCLPSKNTSLVAEESTTPRSKPRASPSTAVMSSPGEWMHVLVPPGASQIVTLGTLETIQVPCNTCMMTTITNIMSSMNTRFGNQQGPFLGPNPPAASTMM